MKNIIYFLILFCFSLGHSHVNAQSLIINTNTGSENISMLTLSKFTFSNNQLVMDYDDGSSEYFNTSEVGIIYFNNVETSVSDIIIADSETLSLYPNPVSDIIYFKNLNEDNIPVSIYRMDGQVVMYKILSTTNTLLDVRRLNKGLYVVKIDSKTLKFIKQ